MSRVSVRLFAGASEAFGAPQTEVESASTLTGLVDCLVESARAAGRDDRRLREVLDQCSFFVDGEHHTSPDAALPEECRVDVLPPFAGG